MDMARFCDLPVVDCHVHLSCDPSASIDDITRLETFMETVVEKGRLAGVCLSANSLGQLLKQRHAERYYCGVSVPWSRGAEAPPQWSSYVQARMSAGGDGVGEMGSKPAPRSGFRPLAGDFYTEFWRRCESQRIPVLCHVADPEEFWDRDAAPSWARERGWVYYDGDFPSKEELYEDLDAVLKRTPDLILVLAHFYFLSADLDRCAAFLDKHPSVSLDLTPGIELLYNLSRTRAQAREFFITYQDRILFGTDIAPWQSLQQAIDRIWILRNFLETDEEFRTPDTADDLMTRYEKPFLGLGLPEEALAKIYAGNFRRMWGDRPRQLDGDAARALAESEGCTAVRQLLE